MLFAVAKTQPGPTKSVQSIMAKSTSPTREFGTALKSAKGEALPYRQIFDQLGEIVPLREALIVTSLPRGSLQIAQPQRLPEALIRGYAKEFHLLDRATWQAIAQNRPVRARDVWRADELEQSRFFQAFLRSNGFEYAAVVPLSAPVLEGYGGALHVYRAVGQEACSEEDLEPLRDFAGELGEAIARTHGARKTNCRRVQPFAALPVREFLFDKDLSMPFPSDGQVLVDPRLRDNMVD